jgi:hypothetical protein
VPQLFMFGMLTAETGRVQIMHATFHSVFAWIPTLLHVHGWPSHSQLAAPSRLTG